MANTHHVKIAKATLGVGGVDYYVQGYRLALSAGSIPQLTVELDPGVHNRLAPNPDAERKRALVREIIRIKDELDQLLDGKTAQRLVDFECMVESDDPEDQSLDLRGWLLTGVGMVFDRQGAAVGIQVEARHPAWKLTEVPAQLDGLESAKMRDHLDLEGDNLHALISSAMQKVLSTYEVQFAHKYTAEARAEQHKRSSTENGYQRALDAFAGHYRWDQRGNALGLPVKGLDPPFKPAIETGMYRYVAGLFATGNWDKFTTSLLSDWYATLVPTFWEPQLRIVPFAPWSAPTARIPVTNFNRIEAPPHAPMPVSSVSMMLTHADRVSWDKADTRETLAPSIAEAIVDRPGRSVMLTLPAWLADINQTLFARSAGRETPGARALDGRLLTSTNAISWETSTVGVEDTSQRLEFLETLRTVFAPQLLIDSYRRQTGISLSGRLMMKHKAADPQLGRYLVPGTVVYLGEDIGVDAPMPFEAPEETGLYAFYLTDVVHHASRTAGTATTMLRGQYVRSPNPGPTIVGERGTLINEGVRDPIVYGG